MNTSESFVKRERGRKSSTSDRWWEVGECGFPEQGQNSISVACGGSPLSSPAPVFAVMTGALISGPSLCEALCGVFYQEVSDLVLEVEHKPCELGNLGTEKHLGASPRPHN